MFSKTTQANSPDRSSQQRRFKALLVLPSLVALVACQSQQKAMTPENITEFNKPGIVGVRANHRIEFTVPKPEFTGERLAQEVKTGISRGELRNETDVASYMLYRIVNEPGKYVQPGERVREQTEVTVTGIGFVVADNTIATAASMVSDQDKRIKRSIGQAALGKVSRKWCGWLLGNVRKDENLARQPSIQELENRCVDRFGEYYAKYIQIDRIETQTSVVMQPPTPGQNSAPQVLSGEIKKVGTRLPDEDVAILKLSGAENLPTLKLGKDDEVAAGQKVFSMYSPISSDNLSQEKGLPEPMLSSGTVSARQDGLIQTDASVRSGIGAPLFNDRGEVIGISTFDVSASGREVDDTEFFVPVGVLERFLQESGTDLNDSKITQSYQRAIELSQNKQHRKALEQFKEIHDTNPNFPYIQQKISQTQKEVSNE